MIFTPALPGAYIIDLEPIADERGFFARSWCGDEFAAHGLDPALAQCNISFNPRLAELVTALEKQNDSAELPEASGDAIAAEFERYLRKRGRDK